MLNQGLYITIVYNLVLMEVLLKIYFACLFAAELLTTASKVIASATFYLLAESNFVSLVWLMVNHSHMSHMVWSIDEWWLVYRISKEINV